MSRDRLEFGVDRLCPACLRHPGAEHAWHNGEQPKGSHEPPPAFRAPSIRAGAVVVAG